MLSGGGAKGAYQAGVLSALGAAGEHFDIVVGTSIGALNAVFVAQDITAELLSLWHSIAARHVIQPTPSIGRVEAFLTAFEDFMKLPPLAKISHLPHLYVLWAQIGSKAALFKLLGLLDQAPLDAILSRTVSIDALRATLIVTATDLTFGTPFAFHAFVGAASPNQADFIANVGIDTVPLTSANAVSALAASAAIPVAFVPVVMNAGTTTPQIFVDGGVANNTPIGLAIAAGATEVTVVFLDLKRERKPTPIASLVDVALGSIDVMQQKILEDDFKLAKLTNVAVAASVAPGKRSVLLREIRPSTSLPVSTLDFNDQTKIDAAIALGIADGTTSPAFAM